MNVLMFNVTFPWHCCISLYFSTCGYL